MGLSRLQQLYRQVLLDAAAHPAHRTPIQQPQVRVTAKNPACGDTLNLALVTKDGSVINMSEQADGCTISRASASLMTSVISGCTISDAQTLSHAFQAMVVTGADAPAALGDAAALAGVHAFPARAKCALLAWTALDEALQKITNSTTGVNDAGN